MQATLSIVLFVSITPRTLITKSLRHHNYPGTCIVHDVSILIHRSNTFLFQGIVLDIVIIQPALARAASRLGDITTVNAPGSQIEQPDGANLTAPLYPVYSVPLYLLLLLFLLKLASPVTCS